MGQSGAKLRTSTDWTQDKNDSPSLPKGSDVTYSEGDLLKFTTREVNYNCVDCPLPYREDIEGVSGAFVVYNLLTPDECKQYIEISEEMGYSQSPLRNLDTLNSNSFALSNSTQLIRNSTRVLFDAHDQLASTLNQRLLPFLDKAVECEGKSWKVCEAEPINKRWRFNKYYDGNYFKPHFDAGFVYSPTKKTLFTFIVYLNEGCTGGETVFFPGDKKYSWEGPKEGIERRIKPQMGKALIFFQAGDLNHRHEGAMVTGEINKYILRSDLAYELILTSTSRRERK